MASLTPRCGVWVTPWRNVMPKFDFCPGSLSEIGGGAASGISRAPCGVGGSDLPPPNSPSALLDMFVGGSSVSKSQSRGRGSGRGLFGSFKKSSFAGIGSVKRGYGGLSLIDPGKESTSVRVSRRGGGGMFGRGESTSGRGTAVDSAAQVPIKWIDRQTNDMSSVELLETARNNLRCIDWQNISLELMTRQPPKAFVEGMKRKKSQEGQAGGFVASKSHKVMAKR